MQKFTRAFFAKQGARGGRKTLRKYGKKRLTEWGKLGGRPRKKVIHI